MKNPNSKFYNLLALVVIMLTSCAIYSQNISHITTQNLVPNPSFEETKSSVKKINHAMRNFGLIAGWQSLVNSPDAHHPRINDIKFMHPAPKFLKQFGKQEPRTGDSKIGMYIAGDTFKEGVVAKLKRKLVPGKYYYFQMYASLGEGVSKGCTSSIGAYFSTRKPRITLTSKIELDVKAAGLICNTKGWSKICGVYKAKGGEQYISLGYFSDSPKGKVVGSGTFTEAYYFMDDILLMQMRDPKGLNPKTICGMALDFSDIEFLEGENEIYKEIQKDLDSYIQYVTTFRVNKIVITGHADEAETPEENEEMAQLRADNVKQYMIDNGVDEFIIETVSAGDTVPVVSEDSSLDKTSNNRVSIQIQ